MWSSRDGPENARRDARARAKGVETPLLEFGYFGDTLAIPSSETSSEALSTVRGSLLEPEDDDPRAEGACKPVEFQRWRGSVHSAVESVTYHCGSVSVRQSFRQSFRRRSVDECPQPMSKLERVPSARGFMQSGDVPQNGREFGP